RSLHVMLPLAGVFQVTNAATAYAAVLALGDRGVALDDESLVRGFGAARLPGRFELVSRHPPVILDGAHNPAGARELRRSLEKMRHGNRLVLLFAAMADKDI